MAGLRDSFVRGDVRERAIDVRTWDDDPCAVKRFVEVCRGRGGLNSLDLRRFDVVPPVKWEWFCRGTLALFDVLQPSPQPDRGRVLHPALRELADVCVSCESVDVALDWSGDVVDLFGGVNVGVLAGWCAAVFVSGGVAYDCQLLFNEPSIRFLISLLFNSFDRLELDCYNEIDFIRLFERKGGVAV